MPRIGLLQGRKKLKESDEMSKDMEDVSRILSTHASYNARRRNEKHNPVLLATKFPRHRLLRVVSELRR